MRLRVSRRLGITENFVKPSEKLYEFHVANLRSVHDGLAHVFRSARNAIAHENQSVVSTHVRLLLFLLGAWSDVRLLKLLYEPNGFSPVEKDQILSGPTALHRWLLTVETAFRRHYDAVCPPKLPSTSYFRLRSLKETIQNDLSAVITMRNKLAHGQWKYPLNKKMDDVAQIQMDALRTENVLSLTQKVKLIDILCTVVHDLAVSRSTFERDWDLHFSHFEQIRTNIERKSYDKWAAQIHDRYKRGRYRLRHSQI